MATTAPDEEQETEEPSPFWQLGNDDMRLLYVTFVGGLASIIVGVLIVGLSLFVARLYFHYQHRYHSHLFGLVAGGITLAWVLFLLAAGAAYSHKRLQHVGHVLMAVGMLLLAADVLGLVGYAAGIK